MACFLIRSGWPSLAGSALFLNSIFLLTDTIYHSLVGSTRQAVKQKLLTAFGPRFPYEEVRAKRTEYFEAHLEQHGLPVKTGARALLHELQLLKISCALATSSQRYRAISSFRNGGFHKLFHSSGLRR